MKAFLFVLVLSACASVFAATRTKDALKTEIKDGEFTATLKEGFHFNEKAPNAVTIDEKVIKPARLSAREAAFTGLPSDLKGAKAALYICDDAITFCETQFVEIGTKNGKTTAKVKPSKSRGKVNKQGFIEDDFNKALAEAKKKNKLVLIDFSARWCPGCLRLEKEMFGTAEFKKATQDFVKLKIDVDRFENAVLVEKYSLKGIPTLLVVNTDQEEVDRIVDFQPMEILGPFLAAVQTDKTSIKELTAKAADNSDVALRLGKRLLAAGRAEESLKYLSNAAPTPPELAKAQIRAAQARAAAGGKDEIKQLSKILKQAIKGEPESSRSLGWRIELMELYKDQEDKDELRKDGVKVADAILADPAKLKEAMKTEDVGEFTGFEALMVATTRAELVEISGAPQAEIDEAYKKAAQIGLDLKIPKEKIGPNIRLLSLLLRSKRFDEADQLTQTLIKVEPSNPELQRRRLRVLVEMKKYNEAIVLGRKVVKNSYGRNEFWAAELLAQAYVEANRMREAQVFIDGYLSRNEIDWPILKASRKTLEELKGKIPKED
jgi:thioredoxin-like negative regulator of GroEL